MFSANCFWSLVLWHTLKTLIMFPILLVIYAHLAKREESDSLAQFGDAYRDYQNSTPAFIPHFSKKNNLGRGV